jgi:hypothetical protein
MTTPDQFLERVLAAVDDAAFRLSHTPHDRQEGWLNDFADRMRMQWRSLFMTALSAEDVDGMVSDLVARVKAKRDEIEAAGVGRA